MARNFFLFSAIHQKYTKNSFHNWNPISKIDRDVFLAKRTRTLRLWFSFFPILFIQTFSEYYAKEINLVSFQKRQTSVKRIGAEQRRIVFSLDRLSFLEENWKLKFTSMCFAFDCSWNSFFFFYELFAIQIIITINQHFSRSHGSFFSFRMFVIVVVASLFSSSVRDEKIDYYFNDAQNEINGISKTELRCIRKKKNEKVFNFIIVGFSLVWSGLASLEVDWKKNCLRT